MERAGTGGALFRNFYRDFLEQAPEWLGKSPALLEARKLFAHSASEWTAVAALIDDSSRSGESVQIAELEVVAMKKLVAL